MKPNQDVTMFAGERKTLDFSCVDADAADAPIDLSAFASVKWALSKINPQSGTYSATAALEKKSTVSQVATGGNEIDFANGAGTMDKARVQLVGADTTALSGDYHQELSAYDGNGEHVILAVGTITFERNVVNT